jgi:hypothetical protein
MRSLEKGLEYFWNVFRRGVGICKISAQISGQIQTFGVEQFQTFGEKSCELHCKSSRFTFQIHCKSLLFP